MKKSLIATAGVAAFAVAAVPFAGVFAASSTVTDVINVTLDESCTITSESTPSGEDPTTGNVETTNTYDVTMHVGQLKSDIGDGASEEGGSAGTANQLQVACNTTDPLKNTWSLTAVGAGEGTTVDVMKPATAGNTEIATGTATSGATSNWAMKVAGDYTDTNGFKTFRAVPTTATVVAEGGGSSTATDPVVFTTNYQVYIGTSQEPDTYTGAVLYTLTSPRS